MNERQVPGGVGITQGSPCARDALSRIWNAHFRKCFPGAPLGQSIPQCRATAYADLQIIRRLRNRIAHHEPIFSRNIADDYQRLHDMIAWRSQAAAWMDRKQAVLTLLAVKP